MGALGPFFFFCSPSLFLSGPAGLRVAFVRSLARPTDPTRSTFSNTPDRRRNSPAGGPAAVASPPPPEALTHCSASAAVRQTRRLGYLVDRPPPSRRAARPRPTSLRGPRRAGPSRALQRRADQRGAAGLQGRRVRAGKATGGAGQTPTRAQGSKGGQWGCPRARRPSGCSTPPATPPQSYKSE